MKILLIDPPFSRFTGFSRLYYPIGLGYLSGILEKSGHKISIYDVDAAQKGTSIDYSDEYKKLEQYREGINNGNHPVWQEVREVLEDFQPDLVGITIMTPKFGSAVKTAEIVKKYNLNCTVVVGGPHATFLPELTMKSGNIDYAIKGEGEVAFLELITALKDNESIEEIGGLSYRKHGETHHNPPREFINDLDTIPFPARHLLMHLENYSSEDMGVLMTSRGCPFNCSYCCHMWERKVRSRSIDDIIEEIKIVKEKYNSRQIEFKDDSFTLNKMRIMELCDRIISEKLKINWSCSTRVNLLDEELIKKMKKSGCNVVKLGIETGSERILMETDKGVNFDQMRKAAKLLNKYRIFWSGYFMMGLPMETEEDIMKTYDFMKEINPYYAGIGVYSPFPKTKLFNQGVEMGLLYREAEIEIEHFFKNNPKDYFFIDTDRRVVALNKEKFEKLAVLMSEDFHKHNTQLKNILRRGWARRRVYLNDFKLLKGDIKKVMQWAFN